MYLEFDKITFMGMLNSQVFTPEADPKAIQFEFRLRPALDFPVECQVSASKEEEKIHDGEGEEADKAGKEEEGRCPVESSEEFELSKECEFKVQGDTAKGEEEEEDVNDGFRTPTSVDHKIPRIQECPPAPRKPRSELLVKRKQSGLNCCYIRLDLTDEIESMFRPLLPDPGRRIKKARLMGDTE